MELRKFKVMSIDTIWVEADFVELTTNGELVFRLTGEDSSCPAVAAFKSWSYCIEEKKCLLPTTES